MPLGTRGKCPWDICHKDGRRDITHAGIHEHGVIARVVNPLGGLNFGDKKKHRDGWTNQSRHLPDVEISSPLFRTNGKPHEGQRGLVAQDERGV